MRATPFSNRDHGEATNIASQARQAPRAEHDERRDPNFEAATAGSAGTIDHGFG
jgi:hypothetical protein